MSLSLHYDVIIVGAGAAGTAAARTLHEQAPELRICLLEGSHRTGGRAYTDHSFDQPVDLGASWIHHYCDTNPIAKLAAKQIDRRLGVETSETTAVDIPNNHTDQLDQQPTCSLENATSVLCGLLDCVVDGRAVRLNNKNLGNGSGRYLLFDHDGKRIPSDMYQEAVVSFRELMEYADERAADMRTQITPISSHHKGVGDEHIQFLCDNYVLYTEAVQRVDVSMRDLIENKRCHLVAAYQSCHSIEQTHQFERVIDFLISGCEQFEGESIELMSGLFMNAGEATSVECDQQVQRGYGDLLKDLLEEYDLEVKLRHVVKKIDSSDSEQSVRVYVDVEDSHEIVTHSHVFTADRVIVTVSLGVLKHDRIEFEPCLPDWKRLAISHSGFGLMNKIVLQFDKPFFGEDTLSIGHVDAQTRGKYRWFLSLGPSLSQSQDVLDTHPNHKYSSTSGSPHILVCFSTAQIGQAIENSLTDDEIVNDCMSVLRNCFGYPDDQPLINKITSEVDAESGTCTELLSSAPLHMPAEIPDPIRFAVTRWWSDRFSYGSYSHFSHGSNDLTPTILGAPHSNGRVRFAGEHTNVTSIGCVDSAYESGIREAQQICQDVRQNR